MSEIDNIFASKGVSKAIKPTSSTSNLEQKKTANKKRGRVVVSTTSTQSDSRLVPEIVIDSSVPLTPAKRPRIVKATKDAALKNTKSAEKKADHEMEGKFQDSRGSESRQSSVVLFCSISPQYAEHSLGRKTEEGWAIYKEDELGIHDKGGGA